MADIPNKIDEYFIKRTDERLVRIEEKLEQLIGYRWMLLGMASAISAIVSIIIAVYYGR